MRTLLTLVLLVLLLVQPVDAEQVSVVLTDGAVLDGVLVRETREEVVIRLKHGTIGVARRDIDHLERHGPPPTPPASDHRLPGWEFVFDKVIKHRDGALLRQIPATVIDVGVLRHVPYMSHRFGPLELNLYGDPEQPACVEVGIVHNRPMTDAAKRDCLGIMRAILTSPDDRKELDALDLGGDVRTAHGLTFEVTPPEAEDSFGGWWVSVYDEPALDRARASTEELRAITVRHGHATAGDRDPHDWHADDYAHARPARRTSPPPTPVPAPTPPPPTASSDSDGGGTVYVRGYYRKDGTYVRPHTRRRARR